VATKRDCAAAISHGNHVVFVVEFIDYLRLDIDNHESDALQPRPSHFE
jgi:hypothetical protein